MDVGRFVLTVGMSAVAGICLIFSLYMSKAVYFNNNN